MKQKKPFILLLITFFLFSTFSIINAQEEPKTDTPYWYVTSHKVNWDRLDSLQKLISMYTVPVLKDAKKSGKFLDYKIMIHHTGEDYNVIIMTKFPSWASLEKRSMGFSDAFKVFEPDEEKRKKVFAEWNWCFEGSVHIDNIYTEATHTAEK